MTVNMKILKLTPHFYWPQLHRSGWPVKFDTIGGMQTQIYRQTEALSKLGIAHTILTLKVPNTQTIWKMAKNVVVLGVRIPILPIRSRIRGMVDLNLSWALGVLWKLSYLRRNDFSLIHVHCNGVFWPLLLGIFLARFLNKKLIFTIHCSILATYEPMNLLDQALFPFARFCERYALRKAEHVIVLTPILQSFLIKYKYIDSEKLSVVSDTIDVEEFKRKATPDTIAQVRTQYNIPKDKPVIGYVGRIAHEKGWTNFVKLAERLKTEKLHFLVCGDGNERDKLNDLLRRKNLEHCFTVTGYVSQELIPAIFANIDLFTLTSIHEEFGGVLIEAMTMEVPVVAFSVGGVPSVVTHNKTGILLPPGDIKGMELAVRQLLDNNKLTVKLKKNGLQRVKRKYERKIVCQKIFDIYKGNITS